MDLLSAGGIVFVLLVPLLFGASQYEAGFHISDPEKPECVQKAKEWATEKLREGSKFVLLPERNERVVLIVQWRGWQLKGWSTLGRLRSESMQHCSTQRTVGFNFEFSSIFPVALLISLFHISLLGIIVLRIIRGTFTLPSPHISPWRGIFAFLPTGAVTSLILTYLVDWLERLFPVEFYDFWLRLLSESRGEPITMVYLLFLIIFLGPMTEELFFRVYWFGNEALRKPFWKAALIPSLTFSFLHAFVSPLGFVVLFGLSVLLCWIYYRSKSPFSIISFHSGWNLSVILFYLILLRYRT